MPDAHAHRHRPPGPRHAASRGEAPGRTDRRARPPPGVSRAGDPLAEIVDDGEGDGSAERQAAVTAPPVREARPGVLLNERAHAEGRAALSSGRRSLRQPELRALLADGPPR